jgi:hypothetical protein
VLLTTLLKWCWTQWLRDNKWTSWTCSIEYHRTCWMHTID